LGRACPGVSPDHVHVQIEGRAKGAAISRAQEAGAYPDSFCKGLVKILSRLLAPNAPQPNGGGLHKVGGGSSRAVTGSHSLSAAFPTWPNPTSRS
jgi:hypothetical protein